MTYSFWDSKRSLQLFETHLQGLKRTYTYVVLETFLLYDVGHDKGALTFFLKHIYKVKSDLYLYSIKNFFPLRCRTSSNHTTPHPNQFNVLIMSHGIRSNKSSDPLLLPSNPIHHSRYIPWDWIKQTLTLR